MWHRATAAAVRAAARAWLPRMAASGYSQAAIGRIRLRSVVAASPGSWRGLLTTAAPLRATPGREVADGEAEDPLVPPDFNSTDPFRVLGVPPGATVTQIKRAYYRLALQYHPDVVQRHAAATGAAVDVATMERRFHAIGDAYRKALQRTDVTARSGLTAEVANALRRNWDEQLLGPKVVESSRRFFKWFLRVVGENYDTLIHEHLEKRDLVAAMDTFHHMLAAGERPTRATFEMLIRGCTLNMTQASSFERADHLTRHLYETAEELFEQMGTYKLKPDIWTYHEMIRASGKAGHAQRAKEYFESMTENAFTLPTRPVYNSMLEACLKTGQYHVAFEVMEEMAEIKRSMWFKGRYRPDAVTVSLLLKAGVDGKLLDKLPRVLELMGHDGLYPNAATASRLLETCVEQGKLEAARGIMKQLAGRRIAFRDDLLRKIEGAPAAPTTLPKNQS